MASQWERTSEQVSRELFQGKTYEQLTQLADFGARHYDAALGRWHAVDPADQFASPYTGMGNNPVMGVDPDGRFWHIVVGAAIGGVVNLGVKAFQGKIKSVGDGFAAFGIGAAAGAVTAATGGAVAASVGLSTSTVAGGLVAGASGAVLGSPIQGLGNMAYFGDPYSGKQFLRDVVVGGVLGGVAGGVAGWLKNAKDIRNGGQGFDPWGFKGSGGNGSGGGSVSFDQPEPVGAWDADGQALDEFAGYRFGGEYLDEGVRMTPQPFAGIAKQLPQAFSRFSRFEYHFGKHAGEWGTITRESYYKRALSLLEGHVGENVQGFTNSNGYTFRMNMRTGEFGIMRPNGVVETFYRRLIEPTKYWAEQVAKWNK